MANSLFDLLVLYILGQLGAKKVDDRRKINVSTCLFVSKVGRKLRFYLDNAGLTVFFLLGLFVYPED